MNCKLTSKLVAVIMAIVIVLNGMPVSHIGQINISLGEAIASSQPVLDIPIYLPLIMFNPVFDIPIYLPLIFKDYPWDNSPFGVEVTPLLKDGSDLLNRANQLLPGWIRLGNSRISWRDLQPEEGDPINWALLSEFESELRALGASGIKPVVIVQRSPRWATVIESDCAPIFEDKFPAFAEFMRQLVVRYSTLEFNVHDWEIGNEVDVDASLVGRDSGFGCWGNIADPYYGGEYYGKMLQAITPVVKAADPMAKVWIGGLLLDHPNTPDKCTTCGRPELFLQGILEAGKDTQDYSYFDVVPYHSYPSYVWPLQRTGGVKVDQDTMNNLSPWYSLGGGFLGKAAFLRDIMQQYGVDKPLILNEAALMCPEYLTWCNGGAGPVADFFEMQADFIVRGFIRSIGNGVSGIIWYTLEGPGWRHSGLLNGTQPKPVFTAYMNMSAILNGFSSIAKKDYGSNIEGYVFGKGGKEIHVLWTVEDQNLIVSIPNNKFVNAWTRDGVLMDPPVNGDNRDIPIGFSPVYILSNP